MNEKSEALRFNIWLGESEILRVTNTGEFKWHKDADAMIANPNANPHIIHLIRILQKAESVQDENERLRDELKEDVGVIAVWRGRTEQAEVENEQLRQENERLTKANDELAKLNVANLIEIGRLRDDQQKVLEWIDVIKASYREEQQAQKTRRDAEANIKKICQQSLG